MLAGERQEVADDPGGAVGLVVDALQRKGELDGVGGAAAISQLEALKKSLNIQTASSDEDQSEDDEQ